MKEKGISDKSRNVLSVFAILVVAVGLFFFLFYSTNLINQDVGNVAQIKKVEKKLGEINLYPYPGMPSRKTQDVEIEENQVAGLDIPSIPSFEDYETIAHQTYPAFSEAYFNINSNNVLSISDKLIYRTGYYSINGQDWRTFELSGTQYQNYPFLLDSGQADLPDELNQEGTHFVIIFSCSLVNNAWDCHGDGNIPAKWQLQIIQNNDNGCTPDCNGKVCGSDGCGGSCGSCGNNKVCSGGQCVDYTGQLLAGSAKVDVSPPVGQLIGGYVGDAYNTGIRDPLYARILVLDDGTTSFALVSIDFEFFGSDKVINQAKQLYGLDYVILSSTHSHTAALPETGGLVELFSYGSIYDEFSESLSKNVNFNQFSQDPWYAQVENDIIAGIGQAVNNEFSASISVGTGQLNSNYLSVNRRCVSGNSVRMCWDSSEGASSQGTDQTVGVMRVNDDSGNTRVMLVNYACHPVAIGESYQVSADYPGFMDNYIEQQIPTAMAMFVQGAAGDIDTTRMGSYSYAQHAGEDLAKKALSVSTQPITSGLIEAQMDVMTFNDRWSSSDGPYEEAIVTVVLGNYLGFVTAPGEFFVQHQINLRQQSPLPYTFFFGYSYPGEGEVYPLYIPTVEAANQGGDNYGGSYVTYLQKDAGELMINRGLSVINQFV
jgi:neutral ceramidase